MKRVTSFVIALALALALAAAPALAQGKGQGKGPGSAPGRSSAPPTPSTSGERGPKVEPTSHHPGSLESKKKTPGELLTQNEKLSLLLAAKLPGTTPQDAAVGFKNLGEFVSAVHVSNNLGIPFADLKLRILNGNGDSLGKAIRNGNGASLGDAIHFFKPDVDATAEAKRAQKQADKDLKETGAPR